MTVDPFGTEALRRAVTEAWAASPARFREDANAEEDHARGHYRDRVVVELAQNAADAATRAGEPGYLRLELRTDERVLLASSTGAPLDAAGVVSLAGLRASAKRDDARTVGRFGVGFAAVRSVADDVSLTSRTGGGVAFSLARTRETLTRLAAQHPALAAEVAARGDALPVLRLPFPAPWPAEAETSRSESPEHPDREHPDREHPEPEHPEPPAPETIARLVLRDDAAAAEVRRQLDALDDALLVALPGLARVDVVVDGAARTLADVEDRWHVVRASGDLPRGLLADAPVEQRGSWSVAWALPRQGGSPVARVLHAPTPTDEPVTLPALLVASLPVDPGRRHVVPGPLADHVVAQAGALAVELARVLAAAGGHPLALVPTGLPAGVLDGALRAAVVAALAQAPLLAAPTGLPVRPVDATFVPGPVGQDVAVVEVLAAGTADLVVLPSAHAAAARTCGVGVLDLADAVAALPAGGGPSRWRAAYDAFAPWATDPQVTEALAAVPVPLADGRTAYGARGVVVPTGAAATTPDDGGPDLAALGVRAVHPDAAHPLLERLGARAADAFDLLAGVDPAGLPADAVLALVAAAVRDRPGADASRYPFRLGEIEVGTDDGTVALRECALPGTWAADVLDLDLVPEALVDRHGPAALRAAGAHDGLDVYTVRDVVTADAAPDLGGDDASPAGWLDGWSDYLEALADAVGPGVPVGDLDAVADLDAATALGPVLTRVASDQAARRALLTEVRAPGRGAGEPGHAPSYTAWWLRDALGAPFAMPGHDVPLVPRAPAWLPALDADVLRAVGGVASLADLDADAWTLVLDDLPDVGTAVEPGLARHVWAGLDGARRVDVDRLPAVHGDACVVVEHERLAVAEAPCWAQVRPVVPAAPGRGDALARALDVPLLDGTGLDRGAGDGSAADGSAADVVTTGTASDEVPLDPRVLAALGDVPATWTAHDELVVEGVEVEWWVSGRGTGARVDATTLAGAAQGLAHAAGRFEDRHRVLALLEDPASAGADVLLGAWASPQPR
ncbi:hypothetical protein CLV28_2005 [Sediminihabitans luteus]|uniref:Uncharacterized protein n=1 Tax=Sediminihabitans luteus TaxID=1138585 RepID=A0A2M9CE13_9CELL|nr:ATP-binding protein [Sediminihabitans luteus]PJJ70176.1 hypothetical protein CLV28_2005 [Sediminihabitans luteus]GII97647.1 hypothetical protein Slu03_00250 [Sediminihabitans luteus]